MHIQEETTNDTVTTDHGIIAICGSEIKWFQVWGKSVRYDYQSEQRYTLIVWLKKLNNQLFIRRCPVSELPRLLWIDFSTRGGQKSLSHLTNLYIKCSNCLTLSLQEVKQHRRFVKIYWQVLNCWRKSGLMCKFWWQTTRTKDFSWQKRHNQKSLTAAISILTYGKS